MRKHKKKFFNSLDRNGYQRNKYLEDLGLKLEDQGTNFCSNKDERWSDWMKQRKDYGFDSRECWNYDIIFIEQLYSHLKMYLEDTDGFIDLSFYKFKYKDTEVTQKEAIEIIIKECEEYLKSPFLDRNKYRLSRDTFLLLYDILPTLWW